MKQLQEQYIATLTSKVPDELSDLKDEVAEFTVYPDAESWGVNWSDDNVDFLRTIGFPTSAPTMLEFRSSLGSEPEYVNIGFNNYGDRLVVDKKTGHIGLINRDFDNRFEYISQNAISLFKTICLFAELIQSGVPFESSIKSIDPQAFENGNWWFREYHRHGVRTEWH